MKVIKPRFTKKRIVLLCVAALVVLIAGYAWASASTWLNLESRLVKEKQDYERLQAAAIGEGTRAERLAAIRSLDDKVVSRGELCKVSPLFKWQAGLVPPIKNGLTQCDAAVARLDALAKPLRDLRQYLDVAEKVESSVTKLAPAEDLTEANWRKLGLERAEMVKKELESVDASGDAKELRDSSVALSAKLVRSWQALIAANDKQDVSGFLAASRDVSAAYAEFSSLADTVETTIQNKAATLRTAAQ